VSAELRADQAFSRMLDRLRETDDKIAAARTEYNNAALERNARIGSLPGSVAARMFRLSEQEFL
jgi:hypothetical protein